MMRRASLIGLALVAGCGGTSRPAPDPYAPAPGPRFADELVLMCQQELQQQALFTLANGTLQRLTPDGVDQFSVRGDVIGLVRADRPIDGRRGDVTTFGSRPLAKGRDLGFAQGVAVRDARTVAFDHIVDGRGDLLDSAIYLKRGDARAKRIATFRSVWQMEFVNGHVTAQVGLRHRVHALVRDVGTSHQRIVKLRGIAGNSAARSAIAANGRFVYQDTDRVMRFVSRRGKHIRAHKSEWFPVTWSPDSRRLLVARFEDPHSKLGVMDPATGRVEEIGPVACAVAYAQWR